MTIRIAARLALSLALTWGLTACDDDSDDDNGSDGGAAGAGGGAAGAGGEGGGAGGEGGGAGGEGGEGGEGGAGGGAEEGRTVCAEGCECACEWLAFCALEGTDDGGAELCPGVSDAGDTTIEDECNAACGDNMALANIVNTHQRCQDTIDLVTGADEGFAAVCVGEGGGEAFTDMEAQAFFNGNCSPCHVGGQASGGLAWDDASANIGVESSAGMPYISAGDAENSYVLYKLRGTQGEVEGGGGSQMPLGRAPIAEDVVEQLEGWINGL